ncbi:chemotaxis protein CheW [Sphingomonas sp. JC676]|uniref:chemotaxis protein CheW n=1 Tax=Sphingomonas sp. JC676 TaxID=2768065 RepID=UPI00165798F2|nr:chemotaxis protein CheW [Sphingomonas sp. JC676]MBC9032614.1 chemotaxis protein CheW [Sphingomonas sp. JC676]
MSDVQEIQAVTFGLGAETFAVPVALVREILDYRETFRIPNGPDYLLGLTDMRGQGVATVDFRLRLGLPHVDPTPSTRILVVDVPVADRVLVLGLVVDRVLEVSTFRGDQIGAAPDIGVRWPSEYIAGVVKRTEGFVVLVDVARIFSTDEAELLRAA